MLKLIYIFIIFINLGVILLVFSDLKKKRILNLKILFNIYFIFYSSSILWVVKKFNVDMNYNMNYIKLYLLSTIGFITFTISYKLIKIKPKQKKYSIETLTIIMYLFLLIGILTEIYIFSNINIKIFSLVSRGNKMLMMAKYSKFEYYYIFLIIAMTLSLILMRKKNNKKNITIFFLLFINNLLIALIEISRAKFFLILIPIIYIYRKKINYKTYLLIGLLIIGISTIWKGLLSGIFYEHNAFSNVKIEIPSEFYTWYQIGNKILYELKHQNILYLYGKSYLDAILNLFIPVTNSEPLSIWYIKKYEKIIYLSGGGRGFSGVVEGYLNFGIIGVIFHFFIIGIFAKILDKKMEKDIKWLLIGVLFLSNTHKIFRSELYSILKTITWFGIYPILTIFLIIEFFRNKKIKS